MADWRAALGGPSKEVPCKTLQPKSAKSVSIEAQDLEPEIRRRAYELYDLRGREDGHEVDDWLRAEEEVTRNLRHRSAA